MMQYERQQDILRYLERHRTATIKQLAEAVFSSEASVRRDICRLEKEGVVIRVYGGVVLSKYQNSVIPLALRKQENTTQKKWIAERAAGLVFDGATIFIDASSSAGRIVKYLRRYHNLKIITNSLGVLEEAAGVCERVWSTGGRLLRENRALAGLEAEKFVRAVNIDILFFSSQGITKGGEISDSSEAETSLRRALLERSERKVFLCDSSKIGKRRMFYLCSREDVDDIICETRLPWETEN